MIVVTSRIQVVAGDAEALAEQYRHRRGLADREPGCLGVEILRHLERPAEFVVVTRWVDESAYVAYRAGPAFRAAHQALAALSGLRIDRETRRTDCYEVLG